MKRFRKGQSTLEYVIILAAVIGAIITVASALKTNVTGSYDTLGTKMENKAKNITF
jgi:Flp pilus assembly pilin Flp